MASGARLAGHECPWHEAAGCKESFSALEEPRLIEDEMAYSSRLFGSLIWIIRGYHIALQYLVTYMLSLERSRWGVGRFRKLRTRDIKPALRASRQEILNRRTRSPSTRQSQSGE